MKKVNKSVLIGDEVEGFILPKGSYFLYRRGQQHACDRKCAAADHRFKHRLEHPMMFRFEKKFPLVGRPDGEVRIPGVGRSEDL